MASRNLDDLDPRMREKMDLFLAEAEAQGLDILVICTYRSATEQNELYAIGRTVQGQFCRCGGGRPNPPGICHYHPRGLVVTNARAGESKHNTEKNGRPAAMAADVVPLRNGKAIWGTRGNDLAIWQKVGDIAKQVGLYWYGDPQAKFREFPHLELRP